MDIEHTKNGAVYMRNGNHISADEIVITLDNGNKIQIQETASGVIEIKNITTIMPTDRPGDYGLFITPIDYGTIEIVPEG